MVGADGLQFRAAGQGVVDDFLQPAGRQQVFHPLPQRQGRRRRLKGYGRRQHRGRHRLVADDADDFLHQVFLDVDVVAPVGDGYRQPPLPVRAVRKAQRVQRPPHLAPVQFHPQQLPQTRHRQPHDGRAGRRFGIDVDDAGGRRPPRRLDNEGGSAAQGDGRQFGAQSFLEPQRGLGAQPERLGGAAVVGGVESGAFQQHGGGFGADFAVGAADNPPQTDGVAGVGDDQIVGSQRPLYPLQGGELFAGAGAADDDLRILHPVEVEGVERLVVFQHHEVGYIDHIVDGAQAGAGEALLQPGRGGADGYALDERGGVAAAQIGVGDVDADLLADGRPLFGIFRRRFGDAPAGERRHLVRHAQHREAVQPVGGQLQIEDAVAQVVGQRRAQGGVGGQDDDAAVVVAQAQFQLRANHPLGLDAADGGRGQGFAAAAVGVEEVGAGAGVADALAGGHIGGAADHLGVGAGGAAGADGAEAQAVGVGVGAHGGDLADEDLVPAADFGNFAHFHAGHGEPVAQLGGGKGAVNILAQPANRNLHLPLTCR